ncbi:RNA-binding protein 42 isoform X3 [Balaenoptera ricei]|uniref:RNA-binding protein 42 n=5 Tax=Cetacea TaxID=9721 RepID=A0A2Y9EFB6_PHYMC|nr:RNA-binding protein 42 isoform X4 [Physeter catodon]XP_007165203.1 RNA-binding protein 42 isoform X3 [Balaenoptera acutorostrata]XP_019796787.1 RNA-binding protein 42 isoform X3 [Tursiops truncatus]XP_026934799.1 RNA-binding protein 42 isoform X3 [Lagenorhynchus obliquidens]XP_030730565.1 RNA-binding protein 42 isoform X4 [Globicephala melas]XP_036688809.1 RNA-binding protein 42 isoform X3 [Balaenoptera musculus]XP_059760896.1 RNA-binding protein 42 isoform X3 [Balaenoptera ricei]XP_05985|eukprot:XP_007101116.1 RNA-binding protein 42 isoform X4 [Physeter catodon]
MAGAGPAPGLPGAGGPVVPGPGAGIPGKSGEERLKEMEAEMALFEQEVLGAPVTGIPTAVPAVPTVPTVEAMQVPAAPVIRPIIATNTYQQVQQTLEARAAAAATVVPPMVGGPPFVGPVGFGPGDRSHLDSPEAREAMFLRRAAGGPRPMALRPPHQALVGPPLPGPPGPPMMLPPMARAPGPPLGSMAALRPPLEEPAAPRELGLGLGLGLKEKEEAVVAAAAGLEEAGAAVAVGAGGTPAGPAVIGPSLPLALAMPLPEPEPLPLPLEVVRGLLPPLRIPELLSLRPRPRPPRPEPPPGLMALEVPEPLGEDKKKGKPEKLKRCIRTAAGSSWEDPSLLEWDADDFRIFCGDLGNEVNDDILARAFSRFPSFLKAKVIRDKRTGKTKGYGFVSFKDPSDYVRAMREMNGKYVGSRPIKLRKSMWKDRNLDVVRKKQKEKKKLGLR